MFRTSFRIATVWGIPIKIHISLVLLLLGLSAWIGIQAGPRAVPFVLVFGVVMFACIALHELGHSFVALRKGCRVREITLMFIGGAAQMESIPTRPLDEFLMALAGPMVSILLGSAVLFAHGFLPHRLVLGGVDYSEALSRMVLEVGRLNLWLAAFNLLPAFPMDGGRVLRAILASHMGRLRATLIASRLGKILAVGMGFYAYRNGLWLLLAIAFFIFSAAGNEYQAVRIQEMRRGAGGGFSSPFGGSPPPEEEENEGDDKVTISPPPYRQGPGSRTDIHVARRRRWPFG